MRVWAVLVDNVVVNVIVCPEDWVHTSCYEVVDISSLDISPGIGWLRCEDGFSPPAPPDTWPES